MQLTQVRMCLFCFVKSIWKFLCAGELDIGVSISKDISKSNWLFKMLPKGYILNTQV